MTASEEVLQSVTIATKRNDDALRSFTKGNNCNVRNWCNVCNTFYFVDQCDAIACCGTEPTEFSLDTYEKRGFDGGRGSVKPYYARQYGKADYFGVHCVTCHSSRHYACGGCGKCLSDSKRYCSNACRQKAYRKRKEAAV